MDARKKWIPFLGVQVKQRLIELNMTQRELAKKIGVNENYLSAILNGRRTGKNINHQFINYLI